MDPVSTLVALHEPSFAKNAKVLRYSGVRDTDMSGKRSDAEHLAAEVVQDLDPRGI
jgi:hypothetical protein